MVCDPMMGEGTWGIAAVSLSRRFTGIEIVSDKFEVAKAKVTNAIFVSENKTSGHGVAETQQELSNR